MSRSREETAEGRPHRPFAPPPAPWHGHGACPSRPPCAARAIPWARSGRTRPARAPGRRRSPAGASVHSGSASSQHHEGLTNFGGDPARLVRQVVAPSCRRCATRVLLRPYLVIGGRLTSARGAIQDTQAEVIYRRSVVG